MSSLYTKYEKSTITKFDIIGSYFVGIYYNELYLKAEQLRNDGKYNSLTQAYQSVLYNYIQFTQNKDFFRKTILGIHKYFISTTKFVSMTYKECIDFIVNEFVPSHLFENIKETQKYNILNSIITDCLKIFTEKILKNQMAPIIDNHFEQANINILQNIYLEIMLLEKDKMYSRFINPDKRNHTIPTELYNTIQKQLKKLTESNVELKKDNGLLVGEIAKFRKLGLQVIEKNKQLQSELDNLKKSIQNNLENTRQYNNRPVVESRPVVEIQSPTKSINNNINKNIQSHKLQRTNNHINVIDESRNINNHLQLQNIPMNNNTQELHGQGYGDINIRNTISSEPKNDIIHISDDEDLHSNSTVISNNSSESNAEHPDFNNSIESDGSDTIDIGSELIKSEIDEKQNNILAELNIDDDGFDSFVQFT